MPEYIEREAALKCICSGCFEGNMNGNGFCGIPCDDYKRISKLHSADVRPVVLCLACRHWDTDWTPTHARKNEHFCPNIGLTTREDWFCADGEKGEEG